MRSIGDVWENWSGIILPLMQQVSPDTDDNDVWEGWGSVIIATGVALATMLIIGVVVWQAFKTWQTKTTAAVLAARDEGYRILAERATDAQETTAKETQAMAEALADMRTRIASMERLLREVE